MLRFAPSPTGDMHIGNLRVALLNYLVAKQTNDSFLVRIEDTDQERNIEGKDTEIMQILEKFAIKHDQVFHQSQHKNIHQRLAMELLSQKKAFICTCTPEMLEAQKEQAKKEGRAYRYSGRCENLSDEEIQKIKAENTPFVVRIKKPQEPITNHDLIKGDITTEPYEVDSFVILRADGSPTYNFACACDDMMSEISTVIRGEDHLSNTPKQIHIKKLLGYEKETRYAHLPIILNSEGKKMSKRDNASSIKWLFEQGFIPDAIINYLLLLGNGRIESEIFTFPEALKSYNIEAISKAPAKFDIDKLRFINRAHIQKMDDIALSYCFGFGDEKIGQLAKLYLEEASTLNEIDNKIKAIFAPKEAHGEFAAEIEQLRAILKENCHFESYGELKSFLIEQTGLKGKKLFKPLRYLLSGAFNGPNLEELYNLIRPYLLKVVS